MYDEESGQVFTERRARRPKPTTDKNGLDWSRQSLYAVRRGRSGQGVKGARMLADMVINVVADSIGDMSERHFDGVPTLQQWRVWRFLEARGANLHAWKLFSKMLVSGTDERELYLYRHYHHICRPTEGLAHYIQPLGSPSSSPLALTPLPLALPIPPPSAFHFITCLSLSGHCDFGENELLPLADLTNLGILEIIEPASDLVVHAPFPRISDRLVRGWTLKNEEPFPLLRVLRIWGDQSITQESLRYVSMFPSLMLFDVVGSRDDWSNADQIARKHGWALADRLTSSASHKDQLSYHLSLLDQARDLAPRSSSQALGDFMEADLFRPRLDAESLIKFAAYRHETSQQPARHEVTDEQRGLFEINPRPVPARGKNREPAPVGHGSSFESWAFWLYAAVGQLRRDMDLRSHEIGVDHQALVGPFVLPSRPLAILHLGHSDSKPDEEPRPAYRSRGMFSTDHWSFVRPVLPERKPSEDKTQETTTTTIIPDTLMKSEAPKLRAKKRMRMEDLLG